MEIIEGEDYLDGKLLYRSLYKYEVVDNVTDEHGAAHVIGRHRKMEAMSETLKKRLLDNGISHKELQEFLETGTSRKGAAKKQPSGKEVE